MAGGLAGQGDHVDLMLLRGAEVEEDGWVGEDEVVGMALDEEVVDEGEVVVVVAWQRRLECALNLELPIDLAALLGDDEALDVQDVEDDTSKVAVGGGYTKANGGTLSVVVDQFPYASCCCRCLYPSGHGSGLLPAVCRCFCLCPLLFQSLCASSSLPNASASCGYAFASHYLNWHS